MFATIVPGAILDPADKVNLRPEDRSAPALRCAGWFTLAAVVVAVIGDGWSGRPGVVQHQLLVLPFTLVFGWSAWKLLFSPAGTGDPVWSARRATWLALSFELLAPALFAYEARHFAAFGYRIQPAMWGLAVGLFCVLGVATFRTHSPRRTLLLFTGLYGFGVLLAIFSFPLNYLRSDMLPVILWADTHLLQHVSPYATMTVGDRLYDFPYLPGMLVAYLPLVAMHLDLRFASIVSLSVIAVCVFRAARAERQLEVACLLGIFLLNPFLQFRHDLYLQPHWLTLVGGFLLMQRRRYLWGAFVFGLGMAIYQFSWIVLPFVLLNALRRRGWLEGLKAMLAAAAGALLLAGPFLRSASARISSNTVGQWSRFEHAIADPMNLSYWLTFLIRPGNLLRLQAVLMVAIFAWCVARRRCATLEDTLRWTVVALTVFVLCNSVVDGYFFLMLLVPMLLFTLIANGWLREPGTGSSTQAEEARA